MQVSMGKRYDFPEFGSQYMVTKGGAGELLCVEAPEGESDQLGKRYEDKETSITALCIKAGRSRICCDGRPMEMLAAKALPSSD